MALATQYIVVQNAFSYYILMHKYFYSTILLERSKI
nr:MAG TPA: hypothetical protein [Caudoviricetes sp.]